MSCHCEITDVHGLIDAVDRAKAAFGHEEVWWRGQITDDDLRPGVFRLSSPWQTEPELYIRFKRQAPSRWEDCPDKDDHQAWMFLMQHHGLPTRLLDWSESALVAAHFAVNRPSVESGVLYALDPFKLNKVQFGEQVVFSPSNERLVPIWSTTRNPTVEREGERQVVGAIYPNEIAPRLMVQRSAFTLHGTVAPLQKIDQANDFLLRFTIPPERRSGLFTMLNSLRIDRASLFPDLDNLAATIKSSVSVDRSLDPAGRDEAHL